MQRSSRRELVAMHTTVQRRLYHSRIELALCVALLLVGFAVELLIGLNGGVFMFAGGLVMLIGGIGGRRAARAVDCHRGMLQVLAGQLAGVSNDQE